MDILPLEIVTHIFTFVQDKFAIYNTCKLWSKLLEQIPLIDLKNYNDPYYLKTHYDINNILNIKEHVTSITNCSCLNFLSYMMLKYNNHITNLRRACETFNESSKYSYDSDIILAIMIQNTIVNNNSKPEFVHKLLIEIDITHSYSVYREVYKKLLESAFIHKSNDIVILMMCNNNMKPQWKSTVISRYKTEINIDKIIQEINMLIDNGIMTLLEIYEILVHYINDEQLPLRHTILSYIKTQVNKHVLSYIDTIKIDF
jgi:hypothetical protein